jgi:hypothetical protein
MPSGNPATTRHKKGISNFLENSDLSLSNFGIAIKRW